jgi:hypothetical protein
MKDSRVIHFDKSGFHIKDGQFAFMAGIGIFPIL